MNNFKCYFLILLLIVQVSCRKFIEVPSPSNSLTSENVYADDATATAVLISLYSMLSAGSTTINTSTINTTALATGLTGDELTLYGGSANALTQLVQNYLNQISPGLPTIPASLSWYDLYSRLYNVNLAVERISNSTNLSKNVHQQLTGELLFLRSFIFFYLVNLYGDVPLTKTSDYRVNSRLPRAPVSKVYEQIISDLKQAVNLLGDNYVSADSKTKSVDKVRPNKWTATALLARVYLYTADWTNAEIQASLIINNPNYQLDSLNGVFLKNSSEAIWQLQPVNPGWNTWDAFVFVLPSTGPTANSSTDGHPVFLSDQVIQSFEDNDKRKLKWVDSITVNTPAGIGTYFFAYKYKSATLNAPLTEYLMVFRLAEQYLIRAEARAQQDKISDARSDLNAIRMRSGLPNTTAGDKQSLLNAIIHERQVELFTEWGHRWFDLKRTNRINEIMNTIAPLKGTSWNKNWELWPIPLYEIKQNPNLVQNPGY